MWVLTFINFLNATKFFECRFIWVYYWRRKLNYGVEAITEIYYKAQIATSFFISADYQFVNNSAYNKDRGPVHVFALRGHIEF